MEVWFTNNRATVAGILVVCSLATAACAGDAGTGPGDERPVVLTTFTVLSDMAQTVAGEHLRVESITKVGAEIHGYEPTPSDLIRASDADLIIDNGLGLEAWFEEFLGQLEVPHVVASEGIDVMSIAGDAYAGRPNPHAWMSAVNAMTYVDNIAGALSSSYPEHSEDFRMNAGRYKEEIAAVHDEMMARLSDLPREQRVLVSCEGAFSYLARDADLVEAYIWPVNAEQQATPQQIATTIATVRESGVPAVFCESTVSDQPMLQVVRETGARFGGVLYVDSLSGPTGPVPTYLDLLAYDAEVIATALAGGG